MPVSVDCEKKSGGFNVCLKGKRGMWCTDRSDLCVVPKEPS